MKEENDKPPLWLDRMLMALLGAAISWAIAGLSCMIGSNIGNPVQCLCIEKKVSPK